jgi:hypothetical protein
MGGAQVVPLMLMSSLGYVANQHPQNSDVVWLLRLCFSIIPAVTTLISIPVLVCLYPKVAKQDEQFLETVQTGLAQHAQHKAVKDPLSDRILLPAGDVRHAMNPRVVYERQRRDEGNEVLVTTPHTPGSERAGKEVMDSLDHFTKWELGRAKESESPRVLVKTTACYVVAAAVCIALLCVWAVADWDANIDGYERVTDPACTAPAVAAASAVVRRPLRPFRRLV